MTASNKPIDQYMALALQPVMIGAKEPADFTRNLDHIAELALAAKNVTEIELPVRLYAIPEAHLQGFTDEIFDWDHVEYAERLAIDIPGKETDYLGELARGLDAFIIGQAKARHPKIPDRFFNCAFVVDRQGKAQESGSPHVQ